MDRVGRTIRVVISSSSRSSSGSGVSGSGHGSGGGVRQGQGQGREAVSGSRRRRSSSTGCTDSRKSRFLIKVCMGRAYRTDTFSVSDSEYRSRSHSAVPRRHCKVQIERVVDMPCFLPFARWLGEVFARLMRRVA